MVSICEKEVQLHSSFDKNGYVFKWNDGVYRAIYPEKKELVKQLWSSGLIQELIKKKLFPETQLTGFTIGKSSLVFRHKKIARTILPSEWSFEMLRDAALLTIEVNEISRHFGYQTIDAHGFNVLFERGSPRFIDLGSFVPICREFGSRNIGWRPYGEFLCSFLIPLKIWSKGDEYFARSCLRGEQLSIVDYWRFQSTIARLLPRAFLNKVSLVWCKYKAVNTVPMEDFQRALSNSDLREKLGKIFVRLSNIFGLPLSGISFSALRKNIERLNNPREKSLWSDYHDDKAVDDRQQYVLDIVRKYQPTTVLDMAANAGFFSKEVSKIESVQNVIAADYDQVAIDKLYRSVKGHELNIDPALINFSISVTDSKFQSVQDRLESELVLALALTHHLILSQNLTVEFVLARLRQFTKKYIVIEFMPEGLYSSRYGKSPKVPSWYTLDWFKNAFEKKFRLLHEETIARNRVILVGEVVKVDS